MKSFSFSLVTPDGVITSTEATTVSAKTASGEITVLPGHMPLISTLIPGEVRMQELQSSQERIFSLSTGFIEVQPGGGVRVLAETAEALESLDETKILAAKEEARKLMKEKHHVDEEAFALAAAALERELARERVLLKYRGKGRTSVRQSAP